MEVKFKVGDVVRMGSLAVLFIVIAVRDEGCVLVHHNSVTGEYVAFVGVNFIVPFESLLICY